MKKLMMTVGGLSLFTALFMTSIIFAGSAVSGENFAIDEQDNSMMQNDNKKKKEKKPKKDKKDKNSNSMDGNMMMMNSTPTNDANVMMMNSSNVEMDANMMMNNNAPLDPKMMNANVFTDANMMNANVAPVNSPPPSR